MYRFPTIFLCLILMGSSISIIYFLNFSIISTTNYLPVYSLKNLIFDTQFLPQPLVIFWNKNNSPDKFCIWFNFTKAIKLSSNNSISLCTHGSIGYSKFIFDHAQHWSDLISVSILLDSKGFYALRAFQKLQQCLPEAAEKISSHLVWRAENEASCSASFIRQGLSDLVEDSDPINCNLDDHIEDGLFDHALSTPYPPNSLRNIARAGAATSLHLIADIENHFSVNASEILSISASNNVNQKDKFAVIVRRFEYNDTFPEPRTIEDLNELMIEKQAFEFHRFLYAKGHRIPGLNEWLNYSLTTNSTPSLTTVKYQGDAWEPQLVVHSSYPYHFEGFPIRRHDQQVLPYELCRAGYTFAVASHVFSFHKGIKRSATSSEVNARKAAISISSKTSKLFKQYINSKYSQNKNTQCKNWSS
jgi:hypothetical protein